METLESLFLIAGSGLYPELVIQAARQQGVRKITLAAFEGETNRALELQADATTWMRVGQLGKLLDAARNAEAPCAIMAGQIAPKNLFDLRPDLKALVLLAKIKQRNAESLFGAIADALQDVGVTVLPATRFLEDQLAATGHIAGPHLKARELEDATFGFGIAKEVSRMDIGQTVVVKNGTVLAVEAFEGTNETIARAGSLGRGGGFAVKVSKPKQDMRFDVPVVGVQTLEALSNAKLRGIIVETGRVLLLDRKEVHRTAEKHKLSIFGIS